MESLPDSTYSKTDSSTFVGKHENDGTARMSEVLCRLVPYGEIEKVKKEVWESVYNSKAISDTEKTNTKKQRKHESCNNIN